MRPTLKRTLRPQAWGLKGGPGRLIGQTKGFMNTKLHAVTDTSGRPIRFIITAGQVSDYTGAMALLSSLPKAVFLRADRGYGADWFRKALSDRGTKPCIPGRKSRKQAVRYDKCRYKRHNRIEKMFGSFVSGVYPALWISITAGSSKEEGRRCAWRDDLTQSLQGSL